MSYGVSEDVCGVHFFECWDHGVGHGDGVCERVSRDGDDREKVSEVVGTSRGADMIETWEDVVDLFGCVSLRVESRFGCVRIRSLVGHGLRHGAEWNIADMHLQAAERIEKRPVCTRFWDVYLVVYEHESQGRTSKRCLDFWRSIDTSVGCTTH